MRLLMSDQDFSIPKPLVLRVEISAEQAASLAPLLGAASDVGQDPISAEQHLEPISDYVADARVTELKRLEGGRVRVRIVLEADPEVGWAR